MEGGEAVISRHGGDPETTNNRMELIGAIEGMKIVVRYRREHSELRPVCLYSDSRYVVNGVNMWLARWSRNDWKKRGGGPVLNRDLWQRLERALARVPRVSVRWIRGHGRNTGNRRADKLAEAGRREAQRQVADTREIVVVVPDPGSVRVLVGAEVRELGVKVRVEPTTQR